MSNTVNTPSMLYMKEKLKLYIFFKILILIQKHIIYNLTLSMNEVDSFQLDAKQPEIRSTWRILTVFKAVQSFSLKVLKTKLKTQC